MNYPYRECSCGRQIHVGGRSECDDCLEALDKPMPEQAASAFPQSYSGGRFEGGMTLRDYFAAKAPFTLQNAIEHRNNRVNRPNKATAYEDALRILAQMSYAYADEMLKARETKEQRNDPENHHTS